MNEILNNPKNFIFPNFCFERRFNNYIFLQSGMLGSNEEVQHLFFEILEAGMQTNKNKTCELLIPFDYNGEYKDAKGFWENWYIDRGIKYFNLKEMETYFLSFFNSYLQTPFIHLVDVFWINCMDKICVYTAYDQEIIVIGYDGILDLTEYKNKEYTLVKYNNIENRENEIIIGGVGISEILHHQRVSDFFYNSFDEYINHWGPILRWSDQQISFLKEYFKVRN